MMFAIKIFFLPSLWGNCPPARDSYAYDLCIGMGARLCLAASDNSHELFWLSVSQFSAVQILAEFGGEGPKFSMAPLWSSNKFCTIKEVLLLHSIHFLFVGVPSKFFSCFTLLPKPTFTAHLVPVPSLVVARYLN